MRLTKLSEFRRLVYLDGSAPSVRTLRARIHEIPGGQVQLGHYYVDLDEYDRVTGYRTKLDKKREELRKDPRLASLL